MKIFDKILKNLKGKSCKMNSCTQLAACQGHNHERFGFIHSFST